jgi:hypothetical protein
MQRFQLVEATVLSPLCRACFRSRQDQAAHPDFLRGIDEGLPLERTCACREGGITHGTEDFAELEGQKSRRKSMVTVDSSSATVCNQNRISNALRGHDGREGWRKWRGSSVEIYVDGRRRRHLEVTVFSPITTVAYSVTEPIGGKYATV